MQNFIRNVLAICALFGALAITACGGSSDPFAVVPDESAAVEYSDSWDLSFVITSSSGCDDIGIAVGDTNDERVDFGDDWDCDVAGDSGAAVDTANLAATSSVGDGSSDDATYDLQCDAGGNYLVAQYTGSDSQDGCSYSFTVTNSLTLASDGETLTGTQVADFSTSGCSVETDGLGDISCHSTASIIGERVASTPSVSADDPVTEVDADDDGYDSTVDCVDYNAAIHPGVSEVCDGFDNNCDGQIDEDVKTTYYKDADNDGYGDPDAGTAACSAPTFYITDGTDCDDTSPYVSPAATEILDDGIDNNCDGTLAVSTPTTDDVDGDGYTTDDGDCDDNNATVYPDATELADGIDNNCDGNPDEGLVTITLDSLPASVVTGEAFAVQVTVTNNSGLTDFVVEARIHDSAIASRTAPKGITAFAPAIASSSLRLPSALSNFCVDANPCTTLASETLSVTSGQSSTYTFDDVVTANAAGTYYFVVRVMVDGSERVYSRAYQSVVVNAAE